MPLIYFNCPEKTFTEKAKNTMAMELTELAHRIEGIPHTEEAKNKCWIYFNEFPKTNVFRGGKIINENILSLEVNAFKGGLDEEQKLEFIQKFTERIRFYATNVNDDEVPVYIIFRDVDFCNWGVSGKTITMDDVKNESGS
ncbi:tautomerase family protein [Mucilaginibacter sp.]|uniref:tautomerase family protein n=1 Tax=Mucilaginibacter sp. TaxID=1882438 RepID=UPI003B001735